LRWTSATFAPPFVGWFHQIRSLQGATKACLVEPSPKKQFVHLLQFAQREHSRQQPEGNRGVIHSGSNRRQTLFQHSALTR
jgi:hypothetical protein